MTNFTNSANAVRILIEALGRTDDAVSARQLAGEGEVQFNLGIQSVYGANTETLLPALVAGEVMKVALADPVMILNAQVNKHAVEVQDALDAVRRAIHGDLGRAVL